MCFNVKWGKIMHKQANTFQHKSFLNFGTNFLHRIPAHESPSVTRQIFIWTNFRPLSFFKELFYLVDLRLGQVRLASFRQGQIRFGQVLFYLFWLTTFVQKFVLQNNVLESSPSHSAWSMDLFQSGSLGGQDTSQAIILEITTHKHTGQKMKNWHLGKAVKMSKKHYHVSIENFRPLCLMPSDAHVPKSRCTEFAHDCTELGGQEVARNFLGPPQKIFC